MNIFENQDNECKAVLQSTRSTLGNSAITKGFLKPHLECQDWSSVKSHCLGCQEIDVEICSWEKFKDCCTVGME